MFTLVGFEMSMTKNRGKGARGNQVPRILPSSGGVWGVAPQNVIPRI